MIAVIDASVMLAALLDEPGGDALQDALVDGSAISAINLAEVAKRLHFKGIDAGDIAHELENFAPLVVPFEFHHLKAVIAILPHAKRANLSLADCACLATARHLRLPVLTADKAWAEIAGEVGVEVVVVR